MLNKTPSENTAKTALAPKLLLLSLILLVLGFIDQVNDAGKYNLNLSVSELNLKVETAISPEQKTTGLSGRQKMSEKNGMLFVFQDNVSQCIWMKDMNFDLDIIWVDENKQIIHVEKDISPDSYPTSFCHNGNYVLEVNGGLIDKYNIVVGQTVDFDLN